MEVAEMGAAFKSLNDQVTKLMEKKRKLKPILGFLLATLNSLRDETIQHYQISDSLKDRSHQISDQVIQDLRNSDGMIEDIVMEELHKGEEQIAKLRSWRLFRQNTDVRTVVEVLTDLVNSRNHMRLMNRIIRVDGTVVALTAEEKAARERLFEAVKEMKEEKEAPWIIRDLLDCIYRTMNDQDGEKPVKAAMRSLREEMDKGVEVVRRSSSSNKDSITQLLALHLCISEIYVNRKYTSLGLQLAISTPTEKFVA